MNTHSSFFFLAMVLVLSACGGNAPTAGSTQDTTSVPPSATMPQSQTALPAPVSDTVAPTTIASQTAGPAKQPTEPAVSASPPVAQDASVQYAIADLAGRLAIAPQDIIVVRMVGVDWPDGSVGCPQPDMQYIQQIISGVFIQLQAGGQLYNYHAGGRREPFLCQSKDEVLPEDLPPELGGTSIEK